MRRDRLVLSGPDPGVRCIAFAGILELLEQVAQSTAHETAQTRPAGQAGQQAAQPAALHLTWHLTWHPARHLAAATQCPSQHLIQSETRGSRAGGRGLWSGACGSRTCPGAAEALDGL